jgi:UDP-N-acetylglucosamine--N-acetylmuramyl-(pentapeptide) pyrophosphoryl-undecaprenol N-acetylglucosamine transferase
MTPGLANKISIPYAKTVCHNFPETKNHLPEGKSLLTGSPIRAELLQGDASKGRSFCGFDNSKPVIMVTGGSLGAVAVNEAVRAALPELLKDFYVVHLCGKGKTDEALINTAGYVQFEYIKDEMKDLFAMADLIISRAGANAICEIQALAIPNMLIPLPAKSSRGDQILNAASFKKQGFSEVVDEEELTTDTLVKTVRSIYENKDKYIAAMKSSKVDDAVHTIVNLIEQTVTV